MEMQAFLIQIGVYLRKHSYVFHGILLLFVVVRVYSLFLLLSIYFTLQYCIGLAILQHESTTGYSF